MDYALLKDKYDYLAIDKSEIRLLVKNDLGSLDHGTFAPGEVSIAGYHQTVQEFWYIISGRGQMWQKKGNDEKIFDLVPGSSIIVYPRTHLQFKNDGNEKLTFILVCLPPWPGKDEFIKIKGYWDQY